MFSWFVATNRVEVSFVFGVGFMRLIFSIAMFVCVMAIHAVSAETLDLRADAINVEGKTSYSVAFEKASAEIRAGTMQFLWEAGHSEHAAKDDVIRISGYTDRAGSQAYNQKLSLRRAEAVADQLVKMGLDRSRMVVVGFGGQTEQAINGRIVEIVFIKKGDDVAPVAVDREETAPVHVVFSTNQYSLRAADKLMLEAWVHQSSKSGSIAVSGFADAKGKAPYNKTLSLHRAQSVASYLISLGVSPSRLSVKGYGSVAEPADSKLSSRRVDIALHS